MSIDNQAFKTGKALREGEEEILHLKGLTLTGIRSFRINVGGNRRVRYRIGGKSLPPRRNADP